MIKEKQQLTGNLKTKQSLSSKLGNAIIYIDPVTQEKTIEPSKLKQVIVPDDGFNGLSKVTVNKIDDNYIFPNGEIEINQNGTYDVKEKESAVVNIPEKILGTKSINSNGVYKATDDNLDGYSQVNVNVSVDFSEYFNGTLLQGTYANNSVVNGIINSLKKLPNFNITNLYRAFYNCINLEDVSNLQGITVSGSAAQCFQYCTKLKTVPLFDTSGITNMDEMFNGCAKLETIPLFDTSNVISMNSMFANTKSLVSLPLFDTSNVTTMYSMFKNSKIKEIPQFDVSNVTNMTYMFYDSYVEVIPALNTENVTTFNAMFYANSSLKSIGKLKCNKIINTGSMFYGGKNSRRYLTDLGGFENLGEAFSPTMSANSGMIGIWGLDTAPNLTEQAMINVLTNLYDIATKGCNTQTIQFGPTNTAKLTSEEGQAALIQAQNYGWTIN